MGCFRGGRIAGVQGFATIGLFTAALRHPTTDRHFHLELLALEYDRRPAGYGFFPQVLEHVAAWMLAGGTAVLRGNVIPLPSPLPGGVMTALYAAMPVYYDEDFSTVTVENGSDVTIVWLIPITREESAFIHTHGWESFEEFLTRQDPDLLDINRPALHF
ncbi:suppressor of fused domain protein [Kitasatospora sp. NPDC057223]|uniref:suppressor of fused domain protein n=1 Tax=Kitasatospora sp. NPDC057223 TaxID=3346055 RepID=UPI0036317478